MGVVGGKISDLPSSFNFFELKRLKLEDSVIKIKKIQARKNILSCFLQVTSVTELKTSAKLDDELFVLPISRSLKRL